MKHLSTLLTTLLFTLFSLWLLLGVFPDYLLEVGQMTPFYFSHLWASDVLSQGIVGPFCWAACALMSTMVHPVLGAVLLTLLLVLLGLTWKAALRLPDVLSFVGWIPSAVVLGRFLGWGYALYLDKAPGAILAPLFWLWAVALLLLVAGCLCRVDPLRALRDRWSRAPRRTLLFYAFVNVVLTASYCALVYSCSFRDANYHSILRMKHAADEGRWEDILAEARVPRRDADDHLLPPTRAQVMLTRLALYECGRSGSELFAFPDGDAPYAADEENQYLRLMAGRTLYWYYGKINYAYRWCMEDMVEYGLRPDYLRYMARVALLNDEPALARKYARQLCRHPFLREEGERLLSLSQGTEHLAQEPLFACVRPLLQYNDLLDGDGGHVEAYLLRSFASTEGGTRQMARLSLDATLVLKDIPAFWRQFVRMMPVWMHEEGGRIPRHYQEAALLFAQLRGGVDLAQVPIDDAVQQRFAALMDASAKGSARGDAYNARALRPSFGDTYWYYYFFVTDLKTN